MIGHAADPPPLQPIKAVADEPFLQEYREPFVSWEQPVENSFVAVATDASGALWSAGPWGVRRLADGKWQRPAGEELNGPAYALVTDRDIVWVAAWDGLYRIENGKLARAALKGKPLGLVRLSAGRLFAGGPDGLWERKGNEWNAIVGHYSRSLTDVVALDDALWIATQRGLFELRNGKARRVFAPNDIASGAVRCARGFARWPAVGWYQRRHRRVSRRQANVPFRRRGRTPVHRRLAAQVRPAGRALGGHRQRVSTFCRQEMDVAR